MKRVRVGLAAVCICLALTACGNQAEDVNIVDETIALSGGEAVESFISTDVAESEESVEEETTIEESEELRIVNYEAKLEILEAKWYDGIIQVNDVLVQLPINFNDLIAIGFDY